MGYTDATTTANFSLINPLLRFYWLDNAGGNSCSHAHSAHNQATSHCNHHYHRQLEGSTYQRGLTRSVNKNLNELDLNLKKYSFSFPLSPYLSSYLFLCLSLSLSLCIQLMKWIKFQLCFVCIFLLISPDSKPYDSTLYTFLPLYFPPTLHLTPLLPPAKHLKC